MARRSWERWKLGSQRLRTAKNSPPFRAGSNTPPPPLSRAKSYFLPSQGFADLTAPRADNGMTLASLLITHREEQTCLDVWTKEQYKNIHLTNQRSVGATVADIPTRMKNRR